MSKSSHKKKNPIAQRIKNISAPSPSPINKERMGLFDWYLPRGTKNADDNRLESASTACEYWAIGFGFLVVLCAIAEWLIAHIQPPYDAFLKYSAWADAGIAFGIVGEVLSGMWSGHIQTELRDRSNRKLAAAIKAAGEANERAADATKKANEAALELAQLRAPRTLTQEQLYGIAEKVKKFAPLTFDASVNAGNPEFVECLRYIELALMLAEWSQVNWDGVGLAFERRSLGLPTYGMTSSVNDVAIFFLVEETSSKNAEAAIALAEALTAEGIKAEARPTAEIDEFGIPKPRPIHIAVGTKT